MSEKLTVSGFGLVPFATVLIGGAAATAVSLHFLVGAPVAFTLIVTCLSVPALTLLFYIGLLMRTNPKKPGYLAPLKGFAMLSIAMGMVIVLDFILPTRTDYAPVKARIEDGEKMVLHVGSYRQTVEPAAFSQVHEGQQVALEKTALLGRIESLRAPRSVEPGYTRPMLEKLLLGLAALVFFMPVGLLKFSLDKEEPSRNMAGYFGLVVPSYVLSLIASGLWIKLFLVHVFHTIDRM